MQLKTLFTNTASIIQNMPIELVGTQANSSQKFPPDAEIIFREWAINTTNITESIWKTMIREFIKYEFKNFKN